MLTEKFKPGDIVVVDSSYHGEYLYSDHFRVLTQTSKRGLQYMHKEMIGIVIACVDSGDSIVGMEICVLVNHNYGWAASRRFRTC